MQQGQGVHWGDEGCWSIGAVVQQGQGVHWGDEGCWSSRGIGAVVQQGQRVHWGDERCWGIGAVVQEGQGVHWGDEGCWGITQPTKQVSPSFITNILFYNNFTTISYFPQR